MSDEPRAYTKEEVREQFLKLIWDCINHWEKDERTLPTRDKLKGLAFSILVILDGESANLPGFLVKPSPQETDEEYHKNQGKNWYPKDIDISGSLHELFYQFNPERKNNESQ